jgi:TolB protein
MKSTALLIPALAAVAVINLPGTVVPRTTLRAAETLGIFTDHQDVGVPSTNGAGSATFDTASKTYRISGGGENMWSRADHFHYVWKKVTGDVALSATIEFVGTQPATGTPDGHRKACLVLRQSLDADSVYADAAVHGDGMTGLQWRETKGGLSHDVQTNVVGPKRVKIERRGQYVMMYVANPGEAWKPAGGSTRISLTGEYYVGIGVSAHKTDRIETATFSNVELGTPAPIAQSTLVSTVETIVMSSMDRRVTHVSTTADPIESPNWLPDATNTLVYNSGVQLYKIRADLPRAPLNPKGSAPVPFDLGMLTRLGHDRVISRDGSTWAVTDSSQTVGTATPALIYTVPANGGTPKRVTPNGPSYVRSFSPDGKTIAYSGDRGGSNLDIYTIPAEGGQETRLTTASSRDDGPEFSPDGQYIYFSSDRSGSVQVWRMKVDGSGQEKLTTDDQANWFPHISPNGQFLVFLSTAPGATNRLDNTDVTLRRLNLTTKAVDEVAKFFGGKGTINVGSWSPTSQHLAFVSYQVIPK